MFSLLTKDCRMFAWQTSTNVLLDQLGQRYRAKTLNELQTTKEHLGRLAVTQQLAKSLHRDIVAH
jgi:hypothetical protein